MDVRWADLPPELLAIISGGLENPKDVVRFCCVCRSWRLSTSPLPNIFSPFFPLRISLSSLKFLSQQPNFLTINTNAVYLLRPRHDPSKARIVSVQESVAGNLALRHALTREEFAGGPKSLDLSPEHWSTATRIAKWYSQHTFCENCNEISKTEKAVFVNCDDEIIDATSQLAGLCKSHYGKSLPYAVKLGLSGANACAKELVVESYCNYVDIDDFVEFKGRIFISSKSGNLYMLNRKKWQLLTKADPELFSSVCQRRFVVSDGDLYIVLRSYLSTDKPHRCKIFRLVSMEEGIQVRGCNWKKVENFGDKVFFVSMKYCSFSVLARDLGAPWRRNCVVFVNNSLYSCGCFPKDETVINVYHFEGDRSPPLTPVSWLQAYSDLFDPPSSFWIP